MIDSHCHLADEKFGDDLDAVVARAQSAGVTSALCILSTTEPDEHERARVVAAAWPAVQFSAGVHPHRAGHYVGRTAESAEETARVVDAFSAVAIGEIGLDYHYDFAPRDVQREVFAAHVALAIQRDLPVVIHAREALDDTYALLREAGRGLVRGVMHCFTGTLDEARRALDLGFLVSFGGILTFPKAGSLREVGRFVPIDRALVETDAPFLAPVPFRGKRNEPAWVAETVKQLAALHGIPVDMMGPRLAENFSALTLQRKQSRRVDTPPKPMV
jgi:TatD DNase family protein